MRKLFFILPILIWTCATLKEANACSGEMMAKEKVKRNEIYQASDYSCNVEIINDLMYSLNTEPFMYAIVTLLPHSGKLEDNWKLVIFEIEGKTYTAFDDFDYNSKNLLIYRNTVRKIPKDLKTPLLVKVVLENDKGNTLKYELNLQDIFEVH